MAGEPRGQFLFAERAFSEGEERQVLLLGWGDDPQAIEPEEALADDERCALISVDEGVIARDSEGIGSSEHGQSWRIRIGEDIARLRQR